jgi:integrase
MGKHKLEPGEHGEIFLQQTGPNTWRGRTRLCLWDGTETWVSRNAPDEDVARLKVQKGVVERLSAARGSDDLKPSSKVGLACRQWVAEMRVRSEWPRPPIRPQTVDEYERLLGNHVVPRLGKRRLNELTPALCQAFLDGIVKLGKSTERQAKGQEMVTTTLQVRSALCMVLDRAVVHDAIRDNPMRKTIAPARKKPNPKAMTVTDVYRLRTAVRAWEKDREGEPGPKPTGQLPAAIDVMLGTGMRIGEVMALRWGEVNLSPDGLPTIAVEATLTDVKGQGTVRQPMPKTDAGERVIIIPPFVVESLEHIRPAVTSAEMPVFPSRRFKGERALPKEQTPANMRRTLRSALALAKMTGEVHPHLLRSTAATFVARRMNAADAAALLGHKIDAGVTGEYYIERLRLAPDTSAVLQEMVDIGKEEAAKAKRAKTTTQASAGPTATRAEAVLR